MEKNNKRLLLITSVLCLMPAILGAVLYSGLPEQIAVHWNTRGEADRFFHKAIAAFGLPVFFVIVNLFSKMRLLNDPGGEGRSKTVPALSIWLIPVLSIALNTITLFKAVGLNIPVIVLSEAALGLLLIIFGNYLPKSRQNYTVGIKLPWTLSDKDNWNKTHRLAGYVYVIGGLGVIALSMLTASSKIKALPYVLVLTALLVLIPMLYSFVLYKKAKAGS